jgi:hypothetical protein
MLTHAEQQRAHRKTPESVGAISDTGANGAITPELRHPMLQRANSLRNFLPRYCSLSYEPLTAGANDATSSHQSC